MKRMLPFWIIFLFFILTRLFPYINNSVPTGYDAGIYLYIFKHFPDLPSWLKTDLFPGLFVLVYPLIKLGVDPARILIPLAVLSQIVLFVSLYWTMSKITDKKTAIFTVFILGISSIQFRTYWYFYLKNIFALALLLPALYFAAKKSFIRSFVFGALVGFFHLEVFLVYVLSIAILTVFSQGSRMFYIALLALVSAICSVYYFPFIKQSLMSFLTEFYRSTVPARILGSGSATYGGAFYGLGTSFLLTIFYLPAALYGLYQSLKEKKTILYPFALGFVLTFLMVVTKFFFYQRMFIIFDVFLIIFCGIGLKLLFDRYEKNAEKIDLLKFYMVMLVLFSVGFIAKTYMPIIDRAELTSIQAFGQSQKDGYLLSTAKEDPAWLLGYTNLPVISWGFGENDRYWQKNDWETLYQSEDPAVLTGLLDLLPKPVYIFINPKMQQPLSNITKLSNLKQTGSYFYKYETVNQ